MFVIAFKDRCPNCGYKGKVMSKKPKILVCPNCNTVFNDFGIIKFGKNNLRSDMA